MKSFFAVLLAVPFTVSLALADYQSEDGECSPEHNICFLFTHYEEINGQRVNGGSLKINNHYFDLIKVKGKELTLKSEPVTKIIYVWDRVKQERLVNIGAIQSPYDNPGPGPDAWQFTFADDVTTEYGEIYEKHYHTCSHTMFGDSTWFLESDYQPLIVAKDTLEFVFSIEVATRKRWSLPFICLN